MSIQPNRFLQSFDVVVNLGGPNIHSPGTTTAVISPTNRNGCVFYPPPSARIVAGTLPVGSAIPYAHCTSSPSMVGAQETSQRNWEQQQQDSIVDPTALRVLPPGINTTTTQGVPPRIVNLQYLDNGGTIVTLQGSAQLLKNPVPTDLARQQPEFVPQQFQLPIQNQKKIGPIEAGRTISPEATSVMASRAVPTDRNGQSTIFCNPNAAEMKPCKRQLHLVSPLSTNKRTRQKRQFKKGTERKRFPSLPRTAFDLFRRDQERLLGFDIADHWNTMQWKRLPPDERFKYDEKASLDHQRFERQVRSFQYAYR